MAKADPTQGMLFSTKATIVQMQTSHSIQPENWSPKRSKRHPLPYIRYPAENRPEVIDPRWFATNNPEGISVVNAKDWSIILRRDDKKEAPRVCLRDNHGDYRDIKYGMFHEAVLYSNWDDYLNKVYDPFHDQFMTLWNAMKSSNGNHLVYTDHICDEEREKRLGTDKVKKAKEWYEEARNIINKLNDFSHIQGRILAIKADLERAHKLFAKAMKKLERHNEKDLIVPKFKDF